MTEPNRKQAKMSSSLDQLKDVTVVVADTGDFEGKLVAYATCRAGLCNTLQVLTQAWWLNPKQFVLYITLV